MEHFYKMFHFKTVSDKSRFKGGLQNCSVQSKMYRVYRKMTICIFSLLQCWLFLSGWTPDDCAMMKGNVACSQLVFNHVLQQRKHMGASVPNTPRSGAGSLPPSSQTTPRTVTDTSEFGMPAAPVADGKNAVLFHV